MVWRRLRRGTLLLPVERDDEAYLDFVEGLRALPAVDAASRQMAWAAARAIAPGRANELTRAIDSVAATGPGTLELDPTLRLPDYLQAAFAPIGGTDDPIAGYIYHYGAHVIDGGNHVGNNQRLRIGRIPTPRDRQVTRVLDLGCAIGECSTALKERWVASEVTGVDAVASLLRYAHYRAVQIGLPIAFVQRLAEDTRFPDAHFDVVYADSLFRSVPHVAAGRILIEARRILRPGGVLAIAQPASNVAAQVYPLFRVLTNRPALITAER